MIKHIVMWTLKEENKAENATKMLAMLNDLNNKIDVVIKLEAGQNITDSERNFDIALYSEFKTAEDLEQYRIHEEHQKVVQFVRQVTERVVAVDYKI